MDVLGLFHFSQSVDSGKWKSLTTFYWFWTVKQRVLFNPIGYGPKQKFFKMFSSIAPHRIVQTVWKFVRIIICIYRSDCNRKNFKKLFWLAEIKLFLEAARNLKIFKNQFFSHSFSDMNFWPKSSLQIS